MYIVSVIDIDIKLALNRSSTHCAVAAIASHALDKPRVLCKCASVMRVCVCQLALICAAVAACVLHQP